MSPIRKDPMEKVTEQSVLMQPPTSQESRDGAVQALKSLSRRRLLKPVHGWQGSTLDAYLDILGLNGREVRMNDRHS